MVTQSKQSRFWLAVIAACAGVAIIAGSFVWRPWASTTTGQDAPSVNEQSARFETGLIAKASFPSSPRVRAVVEATATTPEMLAVAPAPFRNHGTASFAIANREDFPTAGGTSTFDSPAPMSKGHGALIAHWNEQAQVWVPVETRISDDQMHATAEVSHFSKYGFWDYLFNAANQVSENAAASGVECDSPMPGWATRSSI